MRIYVSFTDRTFHLKYRYPRHRVDSIRPTIPKVICRIMPHPNDPEFPDFIKPWDNNKFPVMLLTDVPDYGVKHQAIYVHPRIARNILYPLKLAAPLSCHALKNDYSYLLNEWKRPSNLMNVEDVRRKAVGKSFQELLNSFSESKMIRRVDDGMSWTISHWHMSSFIESDFGICVPAHRIRLNTPNEAFITNLGEYDISIDHPMGFELKFKLLVERSFRTLTIPEIDPEAATIKRGRRANRGKRRYLPFVMHDPAPYRRIINSKPVSS